MISVALSSIQAVSVVQFRRQQRRNLTLCRDNRVQRISLSARSTLRGQDVLFRDAEKILIIFHMTY